MADKTPEYRRLRVYAIDPSLAAKHETVGLNELSLTVPWESNPRTLNASGEVVLDGSRMIGPVGNYLDVVDYDPATKAYYAPIDLNETHVLAQDGLSPSELNPQFHQQMVYAVAMKTIDHFERALGRAALWAPRAGGRDRYVPRLRIYPHALREANAFYHPDKKAVLFGYFQAPEESKEIPPGTTVFTCLSHDVVAHEITHALLDGLHPRFAEPTNSDVMALHEGFADIVAIFQHFANPDVLKDQIGRTRGDLERQNMLGQLAQQFGQATMRGQALRDALGYIDDNGQWQRYQPNPLFLTEATEAHDRGAILVAAVFDAFLRMYKSRVVDLLRIATQGTGILPEGELSPDLVNRLADEAAKTSGHLLQMCIRALDYCPPVDVTFGDYLRALITSDRDLFPIDDHNYRTAIMQSFSLFGIRPPGVRNISLEGLMLPQAKDLKLKIPATMRRNLDNEGDRKQAWEDGLHNAKLIHGILKRLQSRPAVFEALGLASGKLQRTIRHDGRGEAKFEVHSVRTALRRGSRTNLVPDYVVEITQTRDGYFDPEVQSRADIGKLGDGDPTERDFAFRRGCTLIVHPETGAIRWIARTTSTVDDDNELDRVRQYLMGSSAALTNSFTGPMSPQDNPHLFAAVHRD